MVLFSLLIVFIKVTLVGQSGFIGPISQLYWLVSQGKEYIVNIDGLAGM